MTTAMTLTGPWEGLRAYPAGFRSPDTRKRLEAALDRLQHHHERYERHARRAAVALARIDGLRSGMIDQLDAIDAPDADLEPTLCHPGAWGSDHTDDLEETSEDEGAQCDDEGHADENLEASLSGTLGTYSHAVGPGTTGRGSLGEITYDLEEQCEDEGHDSDREPEDY